MENNKEKTTKFQSFFGGIVVFTIGYVWFSTFKSVSGDTRWLVDLVGWFFCGLGMLSVLISIVSYVSVFFKR
jgi:hypothetical protein